MDRVCSSRWTRLSCPSTPQMSSHPWLLFKCCPVSVSVSWFVGARVFAFYVNSQSHNIKFFYLGQVIKWGSGVKEVHVRVTNSLDAPCRIYHWHGFLSHAVPSTLFLPRYISMSYLESLVSHSLYILMAKLLCVIGMYCLTIAHSLEFHDDLVWCQMFRRVVKFWKVCPKNFT